MILFNRCVLSLSQAFLFLKPRTACLMHKHSTTEDNQPANIHSNSIFILLRGTAMLQSHPQQTNQIIVTMNNLMSIITA